MERLPPIQLSQSSLADQVYDNLKSLILSGALKGGDRIPEEAVAQQFGVSRTPIREALKRLSEYGLVTLRPRMNTTVTSITAEEARNIGKVRLALELLAVESIAAGRFPALADELERLARECERHFSAGRRAEGFELDSEFHQALVACAGNSVLAETYERLDARIQLLRINQSLNGSGLAPYGTQHFEIILSLRSGDLDRTRALCRDHIIHDLPD